MTRSMSPQDIQELAAGYVLGDLDSEEAELFQTLLAERPELHHDVAALRETLAVMPYGLAEVELDDAVRSQLLTQTEAELRAEQIPAPAPPNAVTPKLQQRSPPSPLTHGTQRRWRSRFRLPWLMSGLAAGVALVSSLTAMHWRGQVHFLQAQTQQWVHSDSVMHTWSGLDDILQDHQRSVSNPNGPVDFVVGRPSDILDLLSGFQTTVAALPLLPQGRLLGGSNCQFGKTQGLRLTYQLSPDQTVSAYQLAMTDQTIPALQAAQLTLRRSDGTGMVLWRDTDYLYVLVATMPITELQTLAHAINGT